MILNLLLGQKTILSEKSDVGKRERRLKPIMWRVKGETDVVVKHGNEAVEYGVSENIVELNRCVKNPSVESVSETSNQKVIKENISVECEENISVECIQSACEVENVFPSDTDSADDYQKSNVVGDNEIGL